MQHAALTLALAGYIGATGLSLGYLVRRDELVHRLSVLATVGGWVCHTLALIILAVERGRPPLGNLGEAVSMAIWVAVLLMMWIERHWHLKAITAFVMPVLLFLSLKSMAIRVEMVPALSSAWIWLHIALALVGIAAFVLNFAGAIMYLVQERQLKGKRPGAFYYRLPSLETLDRLSYQTLALGFPFLTTALILGALWARTAWGSFFAFDPLAMFSLLAWAIYAGTLAGRATAGWRGRRAAYFAIVGFVALVLTLSAGLFLPGRHGS